MSTQLIAHLKKKCEADDNIKILLSQWEFDQKLVGKALENIGGFYPHFSNHNASHSQQILVNIERILGKDIELLSGTDTWLILEAAYWHDAGMLVDAEKAKKVHNDDGFKKMLWDLKQNKSSDLHEFAKAFVDEGWQAAMALENHPFDGVEKYRQLIAEYFRKEHSERIGNIVLEDYKNLGINTPRTELLPNRLFRYLGSICVGHGMNFDKMMSVLPQCQTGLGTEDCHPLFVACLLRLGDLFDLDDNRFCPVMAKHVSKKPSLSQHHENKHLSLREFQLDRRTVKLVAECPDEMSYIETQNWFGWIREEFQNQMSQWNLIVPNQKFGSLPTIEQLDVRMQVKYENGVKREKILLDNKPMRFNLDEDNAIEILQGSNIYNDTASIFRELIQNAIDATCIRVGLEYEKELAGLTPVSSRFQEIAEKFSIGVDFIYDGEKHYLVITDQGTGLSINDLKYMQNIAGSRKNSFKVKQISKLPQWLKPSSYFGVGLQSAFLLSSNDENKIYFESKSYFTNEVIQVEMYSPLSNKEGYCFIVKSENSSLKVGAILKTELDIEKLSKTFFVEENYLKSVGFIRNDENIRINLVKLEVIKSIKEIFNGKSFFPINFNVNLESKLNDILDINYDSNQSEPVNVYWNKRLNIKMSIQKGQDIENTLPCDFYFKGQKAITKGWSFEFPFISFYNFCFDFYGFEASECLNVSRDYWNKSFVEKFNHTILKEILRDIADKKNGFENVFDEFYNLVKLYLDEEYSRIDKIEFLTNKGYKKISDLKKCEEVYLSFYYTRRYDLINEYFNPELIISIRNTKIIDFLIMAMDGFNCYRVQGLDYFYTRDSANILFSREDLRIDENGVKVYKIKNLVDNLERFLISNVIFRSEQRRANDSFQDIDFPIKISKCLVDPRYEKACIEDYIILPIYYSVQEIHIIPYGEYLTLFPVELDEKISEKDYFELINEISEIISNNSSLKITQKNPHHV